MFTRCAFRSKEIREMDASQLESPLELSHGAQFLQTKSKSAAEDSLNMLYIIIRLRLV